MKTYLQATKQPSSRASASLFRYRTPPLPSRGFRPILQMRKESLGKGMPTTV